MPTIFDMLKMIAYCWREAKTMQPQQRSLTALALLRFKLKIAGI